MNARKKSRKHGKIKITAKILTITLILSMLAGNIFTANAVYVGSFDFSPSYIIMRVGMSCTITLIASSSEGPTLSPSAWNISVSDIVTVQENAVISGYNTTYKITALSPGTTTITAYYTGTSAETGGPKTWTATCAVTVLSAADYIPVASITLNKSSTTIPVGGRETLTKSFSPPNANNQIFTWSSTNPNIATVNSGSGEVVASMMSTGTTTISCYSAVDGIYAYCTVTVIMPVSGVGLNKSSTTISVGGTETLTPTVYPYDATNKSVTWSSSNTSVATVDSNGMITASKTTPGTAVITVKTVDGGYTASCTVTVPVPVSSVTLDKTSATIPAGSTQTLTPTVSPPNAANKSVTWSSSNPLVATVDSNGIVRAVAPGTATITVTTVDNPKTAYCSATVIVPALGVTLNKTTTTISVGNSETLTANVTPSNATDKAIIWSSSNINIAVVNSDGSVTAVSPGTATITVTVVDGRQTASCTVTATKAT